MAGFVVVVVVVIAPRDCNIVVVICCHIVRQETAAQQLSVSAMRPTHTEQYIHIAMRPQPNELINLASEYRRANENT